MLNGRIRLEIPLRGVASQPKGRMDALRIRDTFCPLQNVRTNRALEQAVCHQHQTAEPPKLPFGCDTHG